MKVLYAVLLTALIVLLVIDVDHRSQTSYFAETIKLRQDIISQNKLILAKLDEYNNLIKNYNRNQIVRNFIDKYEAEHKPVFLVDLEDLSNIDFIARGGAE